jgi:CubicO group peptidase (beta-lactamase class C family)
MLRALVLALVIGVAPAGRGHAQVNCEPAFSSAVDSVRHMVAELGVPGAALVVRYHGRTVCEAYLRSYDSETEVLLVSAAKWISAAAILTLVDEGRLRLDDSVSRFLPYFKGSKRGITLRQLLSHTSGLPDYLPCMFQPTLTLDDCARQIADKAPLGAPPGTAFAYGGAAFTVAGRMAEVAARTSWAELFASHLAKPLGLTHTGYGSITNPLLSEGLAYSTASDYATFLQMVLDGGMHDGHRVLSEAMVEEMTRNQTIGTRVQFSPQSDRSYGLGCWRDVVDSTDRAMLLTSPGAGGFIPWVNRRRGIVGVVAVYDKLEKVWPTAAAVMGVARDAAVAAESTHVE